ncbi:hypothetical protein PG996_003043 [Apiospora saccharicola]|uniref:Uncharacterized protein n=1 Tax=Apiospora saccharicola TaxID=335842 RepID=A0ABR1W084_9PEZI
MAPGTSSGGNAKNVAVFSKGTLKLSTKNFPKRRAPGGASLASKPPPLKKPKPDTFEDQAKVLKRDATMEKSKTERLQKFIKTSEVEVAELRQKLEANDVELEAKNRLLNDTEKEKSALEVEKNRLQEHNTRLVDDNTRVTMGITNLQNDSIRLKEDNARLQMENDSLRLVNQENSDLREEAKASLQLRLSVDEGRIRLGEAEDKIGRLQAVEQENLRRISEAEEKSNLWKTAYCGLDKRHKKLQSDVAKARSCLPE